ncbi:integral membrane sensor signal transduction histidine kinase [Thermus thermophilus]|uniref:sensor histidine kinase n=1 Tax=Thermus thermophilus TaxID=274 RepID=UPI00090B94F6|nr:sensor histidine kinase [Thermus thermophilus]BAW02501.1 integral membrane sensor signal transduction histidine kinase [Thermus thermophilus]BDB10736.1 hypothetical protein TthTMY_04750 [Thermus thermophilus]
MKEKILWALALGFLLFGVGMGGVAYHLVRSGLEEALEAEGRAQVARLASLVEEDLLLNDLYAVYRKMSALGEGVYGFLEGPEGEVLVHTFPGGIPAGLRGLEGRFLWEGRVYRAYLSPIAEGRLGRVTLVFPEEGLRRSLARLLVAGFWLSLGVGGMAFLWAGALVQRALRPLEDMVQGVRTWEQGRTEPLAEPEGELAVLAWTLNRYHRQVLEREQGLSLLNRVAEAVNRADTPESVLACALKALCESGLFQCGEAWLGEARVAKAGCPHLGDCPWRGEHRVLVLSGARIHLRTQVSQALLEAVKVPIEAGLHRARYAQALAERDRERAQFLKALLEAQEAERARIARDLHDQVGQILTGIDLGLRAVREGKMEALPTLQELVRSAIQDVRLLSRSLRPPALDTLGLEAALRRMVEEFAERTGLRANLFCQLPERLPESHEIVLYRVVQEALTNVARHARAQEVSVVLRREEGGVSLVVEDDGQGFSPRVRPGLGLLGIRERVELLGGSFQVESLEGQGTTLYVRLPLVLEEVKV